jgi:glycosyltransferase XagB
MKNLSPFRPDREPEPVCLALIPEKILPSKKRIYVIKKAKDYNLTIDEIILSENLVSEDMYYRFIALKLGLDFSSSPSDILEPWPPVEIWPAVEAVKGIEPWRAIMSWNLRITPLEPHRSDHPWLAAPKGHRLEQLLAKPFESNVAFKNIVITTPRILFQTIMQKKAASLTQYYTNFLQDKNPDHSAYFLCNNLSSRITPILLTATFASFMLLLDIELSYLITGLLWPMLLVRFLILITPSPTPTRPLMISNKDLPHYSILVPLYREGNLITQLVKTFSNFDYPQTHREVFFLIEEDDTETRNALSAIDLPYGFQTVIMPHGQPRTKPRALNIGLAFATGAIIVVYDAEDRPEPNQLRLAAEAFNHYDNKTACMQASLVIDNIDEGLLPRLFALEYTILFDITLPRLAYKRWPIALGGSSNHFRREALEHALGWDPWNVTEDADLGLRLNRLGYHVEYLPSATFEDAPNTFRDWFMQRRRWTKGWLMTTAVHLKNPRQLILDSGLKKFLLLLSQSLGLVISILFWPLTLLAFPKLMDPSSLGFTKIIFSVFPLLFSLFILMFYLIKAARVRHHSLPAWLILGLPAYFLFMSLSAWFGVWEYLTRPHYWNKTPHKPHESCSSLTPLPKPSSMIGIKKTKLFGKTSRCHLLKAWIRALTAW